MATTEDAPALEAATVPPSDATAQSLRGVRFWLDALACKAREASASGLCNEWSRIHFDLLADYAERGIREHAQINARLIRKALGGD